MSNCFELQIQVYYVNFKMISSCINNLNLDFKLVLSKYLKISSFICHRLNIINMTTSSNEPKTFTNNNKTSMFRITKYKINFIAIE